MPIRWRLRQQPWENKEKHDLPIGLSPARSGCNERETAGVEHDPMLMSVKMRLRRGSSCQAQ